MTLQDNTTTGSDNSTNPYLADASAASNSSMNPQMMNATTDNSTIPAAMPADAALNETAVNETMTDASEDTKMVPKCVSAVQNRAG